MKKKITIISISLAALLLIASAVFVSYAKFNTVNFFAASKGIITVTVTDAETAVIRDNPRVIIAKPNGELLNEYMSAHGYKELTDERMGAILVYSNGREKHHILYSVNKYYSVWKWQ